MWVVCHVHETESILLQAELVALGDSGKHSSAGMGDIEGYNSRLQSILTKDAYGP